MSPIASAVLLIGLLLVVAYLMMRKPGAPRQTSNTPPPPTAPVNDRIERWVWDSMPQEAKDRVPPERRPL
jgi:hypothetical protein